MSRTYRKVPHFITKESLRKDFEEGSYRIFHCGMTFKNAKDYAKTAMAKERTDSGVFHDSGLSDVMGIAPNGAPLGYKEWSHSRWAKRYANKVRRNNDKAIVAGAITEMYDDAEVAMQELASYEDDYRNYEDYLKEMNDIDWDDRFMFDDPYDPYEEPYYDDRWDIYDPLY